MPFNRKTEPKKRTETDLAGKKMGRNSLQGDDQLSVHNQRHAVPDEKRVADNVRDSFRKLDKDVRAREDLGKGGRSGHDRKATQK